MIYTYTYVFGNINKIEITLAVSFIIISLYICKLVQNSFREVLFSIIVSVCVQLDKLGFYASCHFYCHDIYQTSDTQYIYIYISGYPFI